LKNYTAPAKQATVKF
jgi:hypothetical protein